MRNMSENTFNMVYDNQISDENQNLINDLNECHKKIELLESYRKFFLQFSSECVCRQTSVLKSVVKSLEEQYRQKLNNSEEQTDSSSSDENKDTFVENSSEAVDEVIRKQELCDNNETIEESEDQTNQLNDNFVLVFNKETNSLVKKSSDNIDTNTEMIINKLVFKTPEESVSKSIVKQNDRKMSLLTIEDNSESDQKKVKTYSKTFPLIIRQQTSSSKDLANTSMNIKEKNKSKENFMKIVGHSRDQEISDNIDTNTEMIINKLVFKTPEESVSKSIVKQNDRKMSLLTNEDNSESDQKKVKTYSKTFPSIVGQQTSSSKGLVNTSMNFKQHKNKSKENFIIIRNHSNDTNDEQSSWNQSEEYKQNNRLFISLIKDLKSGKIESFIDPNYSLITVFLSKDDSNGNQKIVYKCNETDCQFVGRGKRSSRDHTKRHTSNTLFICKLCDKSYNLKKTILQHLNLVHNIQGKPKIKCHFPGCDYKALHKSNLKVHYRYHSNQKTVKCQHNGCESYFKTTQLMRSHMKVHSDVKEFACDWPECGARFKCKTNLCIHIKIHTGNGTSAAKLRGVLQTGNYVSTADTKSPNNAFSVIRSQIINEMTGKLDIGPKLGFRCNQIGCKFATIKRHVISQHVSAHLFGKTMECTLCTKKFSLKKHLTGHMNTVHNIQNKPAMHCPVADCQYQTTYKVNLKMHSLSHQSEKPFKCDQNGCSKAFKTAVYLRLHKKDKHQRKQFACDYNGCNRSFEIRDQLRRHTKTHTKPFKCEFVDCSKSYKQKQDLSKHMRDKH